MHNIGSIGNFQGFSDAVVRNKNADTLLLQTEDKVLNFLHHDWIYARKWFI